MLNSSWSRAWLVRELRSGRLTTVESLPVTTHGVELPRVAIVYHASPSLYLYTLADGSTVKVSTNDRADYRYPHMERAPK